MLGTNEVPLKFVWVSCRGVEDSLIEEGKGKLWIFSRQQDEK